MSDPELVAVGYAEDIRSEYFAMSVQRKLTHPSVLAITSQATASLVKRRRQR